MVPLGVLLVIASFAGWAKTQDLSSLPSCARICIENGLVIARSQFGCSAGDAACACSTSNLVYTVRDCSTQACSRSDVVIALSYLLDYCGWGTASSSPTSGTVASKPAVVPSQIAAISSALDLYIQTTRINSLSSTSLGAAISPTTFILRDPATSSPRTTSSPPSSVSRTPSTGGSNGLSTSAKIGLAAGIPCAVIIIALIGFAAFLFRKQRARAKDAAASAPVASQQYWQRHDYQRAEIDGNEVRRHELETLANRPEMPEKT